LSAAAVITFIRAERIITTSEKEAEPLFAQGGLACQGERQTASEKYTIRSRNARTSRLARAYNL
jgi:hypothetical protein